MHKATRTSADDPVRVYYRSADYLRAKHALAHAHSSRDFPGWALALVRVPPEARVLDAGCGWGRFTRISLSL